MLGLAFRLNGAGVAFFRDSVKTTHTFRKWYADAQKRKVLWKWSQEGKHPPALHCGVSSSEVISVR